MDGAKNEVLIQALLKKLNKNLNLLIAASDKEKILNQHHITVAIQTPVFEASELWHQEALKEAKTRNDLNPERKKELIVMKRRALYKQIALITHPDRLNNPAIKYFGNAKDFKDNIHKLSAKLSEKALRDFLISRTHVALEAIKEPPSFEMAIVNSFNYREYAETYLHARLAALSDDYLRYYNPFRKIVALLQKAVIGLIWITIYGLIVLPFVLPYLFAPFLGPDFLMMYRDMINYNIDSMHTPLAKFLIGTENYRIAVEEYVSDENLAAFYRNDYSLNKDLSNYSNEQVIAFVAADLGKVSARNREIWTTSDPRSIALSHYEEKIWGWKYLMIHGYAMYLALSKPVSQKDNWFLTILFRCFQGLFFILFASFEVLIQSLKIAYAAYMSALMLLGFALKLGWILLLNAPLYMYDAWNNWIHEDNEQELASNNLNNCLFLLGWKNQKTDFVYNETVEIAQCRF